VKQRVLVVGTIVVLGLVATPRVSLRSMPGASNTEDTVLQLVQTWLKAESEGDSAALDKLLADDFMGTGPGGNRLNKRDIVPPAGEERPPLPKAHLQDLTLRLFGSTAVVMGSVVYENPTRPKVRFTMVFLDRGKGRQMIAAHLASMQPAQ